LDNSIVHPSYGFSIDNVNTSVKTVVGSDDKHIHAGFDRGTVVDQVCYGDGGLLWNKWH
jgi:hypothetical protein